MCVRVLVYIVGFGVSCCMDHIPIVARMDPYFLKKKMETTSQRDRLNGTVIVIIK